MCATPRSPPQLLQCQPPRTPSGGCIYATPLSRPCEEVARSRVLLAPPHGLAPPCTARAQVAPEARCWHPFRRHPLGWRRRRPSLGEREAPWSSVRRSHERPLRERLWTRARATIHRQLPALRTQGVPEKRLLQPEPPLARLAGAQPATSCALAPAPPPAPSNAGPTRHRPGHGRQTAPLPPTASPSTRAPPPLASARPPAPAPLCQSALTRTSVRRTHKRYGSHQRRRYRSATGAPRQSFPPRSSRHTSRKPMHLMSSGRLRSPLLLHSSPTSPSFL